MIRRKPEQVWSFLGDISNIAKWDRGVAGVRELSEDPPAVGFEFDTFAGEQRQGRMSYRVSEVDQNNRHCTVQLTSSTGNARFFKTAQWDFRVKPVPEGALLTCSTDFVLRFRYLFLAPILYMAKDAIHVDLESLKRVLEEFNVHSTD